MTDERKRHFARFYYDAFIHEYPEVYADDAALSAWLRLLVIAEKAWPGVPELPRSVSRRALATLTHAGLLALGPRYTFALLGHDKERSRRYSVAIAGANASANARANAQANAAPIAEPRREEEEKEKKLPLPRRAGRRDNGTNPRAMGTNPRAQGTSPRQEREAQKRGGAQSINDILTAIQTKGKA